MDHYMKAWGLFVALFVVGLVSAVIVQRAVVQSRLFYRLDNRITVYRLYSFWLCSVDLETCNRFMQRRFAHGG